MLWAHNRGYRISESGEITNPNGERIFGYKTKDGYVAISCKIDGKPRSFSAHRLVAYQKYGDQMFDDGIEVRHLDGNPANNSSENIVIGTHSQNMLDIEASNRIQKATKASHKHHNQDRWADIDADRDAGMSYRRIQAKYGIARSTLSFRYSRLALQSIGS